MQMVINAQKKQASVQSSGLCLYRSFPILTNRIMFSLTRPLHFETRVNSVKKPLPLR